MKTECSLDGKLYNLFMFIIQTKPIETMNLNSEQINSLIDAYSDILFCDLHNNYFQLYMDELYMNCSNNIQLITHNFNYLRTLYHSTIEENKKNDEFGQILFDSETTN